MAHIRRQQLCTLTQADRCGHLCVRACVPVRVADNIIEYISRLKTRQIHQPQERLITCEQKSTSFFFW